MKPISFVLLAVFGLVSPVLSQSETTHDTSDPVVDSSSEPPTARIIGTIPDGTPPPPAPPKPEFFVAAKNILSVKALRQGGRTITIREIKPIALPPPPPQPTYLPRTAEEQAAFRAEVDAYYAKHPRCGLFMLSASVYRSKDSQPRTLVHYWSEGAHNVTFWSSADFGLIAGGIHSFMDSEGETHSLIMGWSYVDIDRMTELREAKGLDYEFPVMPEFPDGKATWQAIGEQPAPEDFTTIQALHDIYNREHDRLLTAFQGREQARIQREAELKANPPKPKNITLNYWRTETPAPNGKGSSR